MAWTICHFPQSLRQRSFSRVGLSGRRRARSRHRTPRISLERFWSRLFRGRCGWFGIVWHIVSFYEGYPCSSIVRGGELRNNRERLANYRGFINNSVYDTEVRHGVSRRGSCRLPVDATFLQCQRAELASVNKLPLRRKRHRRRRTHGLQLGQLQGQ